MDFLIFAVAVISAIFAWRFVFKQFTGAGRSKPLSHFLALMASSFIFVAILVGWIVASQTESDGTLPTSSTEDVRKTKIPEDITYNIIKDESKRDIKRNVEVSLNKKVSEDVLSEIALTIKQSEKQTYQETFIGYFIEGNDKQGYWATTNFNPNLDIKIIGLSANDEKTLIESSTLKPDREIIGSWLDDRPGIEAKMTLFYTNKALFLEFADRYGGIRVKKMSKHRNNGEEIVEYKDGNDFKEYFLINANGELEFWSPNKNFYIAKKLSN
ncbi:MAG: hypothetical protein ACXV8Q_00450 [Methylobacter sp.]